MKLPQLLAGLLLAACCLNPLSAAPGEAAKTLPPLVLKSSFKSEVENFQKSTVTTELFKRYEFVARAIDGGGDFASSVQRLRTYQKEDLAKWADLATQEFKEPKPPKEPKGGDKNAKKAYDTAKKAYDKKLAAASMRFENQKAVATAYATWLKEDIGTWINGLKPVEKAKPAN